MEEDQSPVPVHSVGRRHSPRSSRPVPYPKQGSRRAISSSFPHDRSTSSGSDDSLTWATEYLKKRFKDAYRKHGSLKERRDLNIKYKHIGCNQCADRGIQCTTRATALRCGQCPAYVKCTRVNILKKLRVTKLIDISEEQYDYLLRWYKQHEQEELLKSLEGTLLKASIGVSQNAETSVVHPNRAPCQYPPSAPRTESECHSESKVQSNTRSISSVANEQILNQQKHSSYSSPFSKHSPPAAPPKEAPDNGRTVAARNDLGSVDSALENYIDVPAHNPESAGPTLPISSMYNYQPPTALHYSPQPPPHQLSHLYAPIPFTFPNNSLLEHGNSGTTSSNAASAASAAMRFNAVYPCSVVTWDQDAMISTDGGEKMMVAGTADPGDNWDIVYSEYPYPRTNHRNLPLASSSHDRPYGDPKLPPHPPQFYTSETNLVPGPSVNEFETRHFHYGYYQNQGPRPNTQVCATGGQPLPPSLGRVMY